MIRSLFCFVGTVFSGSVLLTKNMNKLNWFFKYIYIYTYVYVGCNPYSATCSVHSAPLNMYKDLIPDPSILRQHGAPVISHSSSRGTCGLTRLIFRRGTYALTSLDQAEVSGIRGRHNGLEQPCI